jgi:hypothetical protein
MNWSGTQFCSSVNHSHIVVILSLNVAVELCSLILCDFRENVNEHEMCVLIVCTTFVRDISHSKKNLARYCLKHLHVKYPLFL